MNYTLTAVVLATLIALFMGIGWLTGPIAAMLVQMTEEAKVKAQ